MHARRQLVTQSANGCYRVLVSGLVITGSIFQCVTAEIGFLLFDLSKRTCVTHQVNATVSTWDQGSIISLLRQRVTIMLRRISVCHCS